MKKFETLSGTTVYMMEKIICNWAISMEFCMHLTEYCIINLNLMHQSHAWSVTYRGENEFSDTRIVVQKFAGLNCKRRLTQAKTTDSNARASCAVVQLSSDSTDFRKRIM